MATHSSNLAWRIPWTEEPGRLQSMCLQKVRHDWTTNTHSHPYTITGKTIVLTKWTFVSKAMTHIFNMLSSFVLAFLPRSKSFNFKAALTICSDFGAQENKLSYCFHSFPIYLPWSNWTRHHRLDEHEFEQAPGLGDGQGSLACCSPKESDATEWLNWTEFDWMAWSSFFEHWVLSQLFHSPLSLSSRGSLVSLLSASRVVSSAYLRLLIFLLAMLIPACASSSLAFCMMYSVYKLNSRVIIYSPDELLSQFGTSLLFHVWF